MDFYSVIKKIDELTKELEQAAFSPVEKDIIKSKISETYLLLFEKQEVEKQPPAKPPVVELPIAVPTIAEPPIQKEIPTISVPQQPVELEIQPQKPLNVDYKSLVDTFLEKEPPKPTLAEDQSLASKMSQAKIVDLKRSIAMNDRFIFIKELFRNDFDAYNRYINDLNGCVSMEQAEQYLAQLKRQYEWNEENETVHYFLSLIGRKFQ